MAPSLSSSTFWYACHFGANNFSFESQSWFTKISISGFSFKKIIGGDRYIFFITSDNELAQISEKEPLGNTYGLEHRVVPIELSWNDGLGGSGAHRTKSCSLQVLKFGSPTAQYFMNITHIFAVDVEKQRVESVCFTGNDPVSGISIFDFTNGGIKTFFTGPLSSVWGVLTHDGKLYEKNQLIDISNIGPIKLATCSGSGIVVVNDRDEIYGKGGNTFGIYGEDNSNNAGDLNCITPGTILKDIVDIKSGFYHIIVILRDGSVYGIGYNILNQATFENIGSTDYVTKFHKIARVKELAVLAGCSSRGTWIKTEEENVFMAGEVVSDFTEQSGLSKQTPKIYTFNFNELAKETNFETIPNDIAAAGWQYAIFQNCTLDDKLSKSLKYMKQQLKEMVTSPNLSDIIIDWSTVEY